ncbi:MAG: NUDIX domain-containing protein [Nanoarchaeota archaeon]
MKTDLTAAGYIFHQNKLLLIHHAKLNIWLPPGGHIESNEIPDDAALREIEEETGIKARIIDALPSVVPRLTQGVKRQTTVPFYVTNVKTTPLGVWRS